MQKKKRVILLRRAIKLVSTVKEMQLMDVKTIYEDSIILPKGIFFSPMHPTYIPILTIRCFKSCSEPENTHHGHFQPRVMSII